MAKRRMGFLAILLCLCLLPVTALAASTTDAKEPIDTAKNCTLALRYGHDDLAFPGQTVQLYKIADVSADFQYTLAEPFGATGLILNGIQTNGEWNEIRSTLEAFILAENAQPIHTAVTDEEGMAHFEGLQPGLYLVSALTVARADVTCIFDAALVALPGLGTDGRWQYEVTAAAKGEVLPPVQPDEKLEMKVLKLWRGDEGENVRPQNITVEIFRNGESVETVILSEENNWSYRWEAKDDGANWNVVERNIPEGYTMTVTKRGTAFVLTNTFGEPVTPPPQTGDSANLLLYAVLMVLSGSLLIILGIAGKRNQNEKKN